MLLQSAVDRWGNSGCRVELRVSQLFSIIGLAIGKPVIWLGPVEGKLLLSLCPI